MRIAVDANQAWGVRQAIEWLEPLAQYDPYWIEEPTSPDDILGHAAIRAAVAPIRVATGEHTHNAGDVQTAAAGRRDRRTPTRRDAG